MPDPTTPGQIAYEVYRQAILRPDAPPFRLLPYVEAAAWEAAALAVAEDAVTNLLEVQRILAAAKETP